MISLNGKNINSCPQNNYSAIKIWRKQYVYDVKPVYTHILWFVEVIRKYKLYEIRFDEGNIPYFLLTAPDVALRRGAQYLYIKPIPPDELWNGKEPAYPAPRNLELLKNFAKVHSIPLGSHVDEEGVWKTLLSHYANDPLTSLLFWKLARPVEEGDLDKVKNLDFDALIHDYLYEDQVKDEDLVYFYRPLLIRFTNPLEFETKAASIQPYQSHGIIVTRTKAGKSTLGNKLGFLYDSATSAKLVGFATAEEVVYGDLHGQTKPFFLDDVHKLPEYVLEGLTGYLEKGVCRIGKGKETIETIGISAITLHANLKKSDLPEDLMRDFLSFLDRCTQYGGVWGSRIPRILFKPDSVPVRKNPNRSFTREEMETVNAIVEMVTEEAAATCEKIFFDDKVQAWLQGGRIEDLDETVSRLLQQATTLDAKVVDFWNDYRECHRHIRGTALLHAMVDHLKDIWLGTYDVNIILGSAKQHLHKVCDQAVRSLQEMIKVSDQAPLKDWALATYRNLTPEYVKATVLAGAIYHITNILLKPKGEVVVSWQELSRFYDDFYPHVPQELRPSESYRYLTRVLQNLPSNLNKINQQLRSFGIELLRKDGTIYLRYESDPKRLQNMTYLYNAVYQDNAVYQVPP